MKALAIDTAVSCIYIAAKCDENTVTLRLDIGMKQAEKLLPAIDYVLNQVGLSAKELDYMALTVGPGSFTGLRLGMSALKAIHLAYNIPVYAFSTLDVYAYDFSDSREKIISVIDAKKDRFYACVYAQGVRVSEPFDEEPSDIAKRLESAEPYVAIGADSALFVEKMHEVSPNMQIRADKKNVVTTDALFLMAEEKIAKKEPPLQDYDGPFYIRKSEAEEKLPKNAQ